MLLLRGLAALLSISLNSLVLCVPLYLLGLVRLASWGRLRAALARRMDDIVQLWVAGNRAIFRLLGVTRLHRQWDGDTELSRDRWYLVVSNHQSWADILVLQNALWGRIPMLKFFAKRELIWVPVVGLAMWFLGFPYVRRFSAAAIAADPTLAELDRQTTLTACRRFREQPSAVLSFLEGSRFSPAKRDGAGSRFVNLLNPKLGGMSYVVDALKDRIHKVLDVTIVYGGEVPSFWELLQGRCRQVQVVVRCLDLPPAIREAADADEVRERLRPWIEQIWQEKDARLSGLAGLAN